MRELKKRNETLCCIENDSVGSDSVSSSASPPRAKKKRQHYERPIFTQEVGDTDYFQLPGRERCGQRSSGKREICMPNCLYQYKEKEFAIKRNVVSNGEENCVNGEEFKCQADGSGHVKANVKGTVSGREALNSTLISLTAVRTFMEALIEELKEERSRMLQWMRQEMHNMLHEGPATRGVPTSCLRQTRGNQDLNRQKVLLLNGTMTTRSNLNNCDARRQYDGQSLVKSGHEFAGHSRAVVTTAGMKSCDNPSATRGSHYRMQALGNMQTEIEGRNERTSGVKLAAPKTTSPDAIFGTRNIGSGHTRETEIGVAMFDCKGDSLAGLDRRNEGSIDFSIHNDIEKSSEDPEFHIQNGLCGEVGFVLESGTNGGPVYGHSSDSGSVMNFKEQSTIREIGEFKVSLGLHNTGRSNSAGLGNNQGPRFLKDDNTPDVLGVHCKDEAAELQNSLSLNVWNIMQQQGGRNFMQGLSGNGVPSFNYDSIVKFRNGGDISGGIPGNDMRFDNPSEMIRSPLQNDTLHLGRQVSTPKANHNLYSNGVRTLITSQNQGSMQSPSALQNFLGLNVGVNMQMFPDIHFQENGQESFYSSNRAGISMSPNVSLTNNRGNGLFS